MKNKTVLTIMAILISLVLFVSCNDSQEKGFGSLSVVLDNSLNTKSIQPDADKRTFHHYVIYGTPESDKVQPVQQTFTALSIQIDNLASGKWTFYIEGYNADNLLIGKSTTHEITVARDTVVRESYYLDWIQGQGILKLSIKVQTSRVNTIDCVLHTEGKDDITVTLTRDNRTLGQDGLYLYENSFYVFSGIYDATITMKDSAGNTIGVPLHQSAHIFDKMESAYEFSYKQFKNLIAIDNPYPSSDERTIDRDSSITLQVDEVDADIYYSINNESFKKYTSPINVNNEDSLSNTCSFELSVYAKKQDLTDSETSTFNYQINHDMQYVEAAEATCTEDGYSAHYKCQYCGCTEGYEQFQKHHEFVEGICVFCGIDINEIFEIEDGCLKKLKDINYSGDLLIPNNITTIGDYAFKNCTKLNSVTIPSSVASIGNNAFYGWTSNQTIIVKSGFVSGNNPYTWNNCKATVIAELGNDVTSIGSSAFEDCTGLTSITIPSSVTSIGSSAFYGCTGLTKVEICGDISTMGSFSYPVFEGCTSLEIIAIKDGVTSIPSYAFSGCSGLTSITIPSSVTGIGYYVFSGWTSNQTITVKSGFASGNHSYPWYDCKATVIAELGNDVTSIGSSAFEACTGLTSITIPSSVTSIDSDAFYGCSGLTSITIPSSVTSIGSSAFYGCSGLTSITIPSSVTSIGSSAFSGCSGLTSITIPSSVTGISFSAFEDCTGLTSITINKVKYSISGAPWGATEATVIWAGQ